MLEIITTHWIGILIGIGICCVGWLVLSIAICIFVYFVLKDYSPLG